MLFRRGVHGIECFIWEREKRICRAEIPPLDENSLGAHTSGFVRMTFELGARLRNVN